MRQLATHRFKPESADDFFGPEMLKFHRISPGFLGQADEIFGFRQLAVMIGGYIGDKVRRILQSNLPSFDLNVWNGPPPLIVI
jgi:hypothetical protein